MNKKKTNTRKKIIILKIIHVLLFLFFVIIGTSYVFSNNKLNIILSTKFGFAQLYPFFNLFCFMVIIFYLIFFILYFIKNKFKYKNNITNTIIVSIILFSLFFIMSGTDVKKPQKYENGKKVKIVEYNVLNNLDENHVKEIFGKFDADIAVFPEFGFLNKGYKNEKERLKSIFDKANINFDKYDFFVSTQKEKIYPVTIIVKKDFERYSKAEKIPTTFLGTVYLKPENNKNVGIIGIHTMPPLASLKAMYLWRSDLINLKYISDNNKDSIILGDFNAIMKQGALNNIKFHEDLLQYANPFNRGTWHRKIPNIFRTTIDHILVPVNKYRVNNVEIKNFKNSDHVCIYAELEEK